MTAPAPVGIFLATLLSGLAASLHPVMAQSVIDLPVGHSEILQASEIPATVVIGEPNIADVTIANRTVVLTAREVGRTNLILLDADGDELLRSAIQVVPLDRRPQRDVRVIEGGSEADGTRYLCGPRPGCFVVTEGERSGGVTAEVVEEASIEQAVEPAIESVTEPAQTVAPDPEGPVVE